MTEVFQVYHHSIDYTSEEQLKIRLWCHNRDSKPTLINVIDYHYSIYVELPKFMATANYVSIIKGQLEKYLRPNGRRTEDYSNFGFTIEKRKGFYGYSETPQPFIKMTFDSKNAVALVKNKLTSSGVNISKFSNKGIKLNVYEDKISPIRKMFTDLNMKVAEWFSIVKLSDRKVPQKSKTAKCDEYNISYKDIRLCNEETKFLVSKPWIMSYDIESYSDNDREFPIAYNSECVCYMISCTFEQLGDVSTRKYYCIYIGEEEDLYVGDVKVHTIATEDEATLLKKFFKLIETESPTILTGYNLGGFDNDYICRRAMTNLLSIDNPSLLYRAGVPYIKPAEKNDYRSKNDSNLFTIPGRITIDMLDYMKRVYPSLTKHSLDFVSNKYIKETKHDVTAPMMFEAYRNMRCTQLRTKYDSFDDKDEAEDWKDDLSFQEIKWLDKDIDSSFKATSREKYREVAAYCCQDTILPLKLMNKLDVWTAQTELSNLMGVPIEQLLTDGEQVRCFSQIYDLFHTEGFVLIPKYFANMNSEGGLVTYPDVGRHNNVMIMDFASLYPSIMRAYNISLETIILDPTEENVTSEFDVEVGRRVNTKVTNPHLDQLELPSYSDDVAKTDDEDCHVIKFSQMEIQPDPLKNNTLPNKHTKRAKELTKEVPYVCKYVKKEVYHGILPKLMETLLKERNKLRANIKILRKEYDTLDIYTEDHPDYNKDHNDRGKEVKLMCSVFDARQLAMKVSMNSIYGFLKVRRGAKLPFPDGARTITAKGREHIRDCNRLMSTDIDKLISNLSPENIPKEMEEYDITTPCSIVYNDTDSCFVKAPHIRPKHMAAYGKMLQKAFSYIFDKSLILEYEQTLSVVLLVSKKRYTGFIMNDATGERLIDKHTGKPEMYTKGLVTAKRDGASFVRDVFNTLAADILEDYPMSTAISKLFASVESLLRGDLSTSELSLMKKIGYEYKSNNSEMAMFKSLLEERKRKVNPGEKVDFLMCINPKDTQKLIGPRHMRNGSVKIGERHWLIEEVSQGSSPPIDLILYLDKIGKAIDQIFSIAYPDRLLENITYYKNRAKKPSRLLTPMRFLSNMAYNYEELIYKISEDEPTYDEVMEFVSNKINSSIKECLGMILHPEWLQEDPEGIGRTDSDEEDDYLYEDDSSDED